MDSMDKQAPGLGETPKDEWPKYKTNETRAAIELLNPKGELHGKVLEYLKDRLILSERSMSAFYDRWRVNEKKLQAYIAHNNWEQMLKELNDKGNSPKQINIVVPYTFATLSTIATYLIHIFAGRKPMFSLGANRGSAVRASQNMETILQYNADHIRAVRHLWQFINDGQSYGVSVLRCQWKTEDMMRTVWKTVPGVSMLGIQLGSKTERVREKRRVFEGNDIASVDPFMFFPDPRVPMTEVNRRGEFVFWRTFEGRHTLKSLEAEGVFKYIDHASPIKRGNNPGEGSLSNRDLISSGTAHPGFDMKFAAGSSTNYYQVDQGTVEIIPAELGLGKETSPMKYVFAILNKSVIIQAEPLNADHDMHPVAVSEPYSYGYGFGQPGMCDYLNPIQDTLSWLVNSHMDNVKIALNNMWLVDPSKIELQDMKRPGPGRLIRMKRSAYGQDIRQSLMQLETRDVTSNHFRDFEAFIRIGDALSGVNDNLRGLQAAGGRKTATEVRATGEAGASRLAACGKVISAQGLTDLTEMMTLNVQQNMSEDFIKLILGEDAEAGVHVSPEHIVGDFYFPVHDGTLPLDKVAMLDVWKELFLGVAADPGLRQGFDLVGMFKYIAELGGAKNVEEFMLNGGGVNMQVMPDDQAGELADKGQISQIGPSPAVNANPVDPSNRAAGALT